MITLNTPGVYTLSESFNFDSIDENTCRTLGMFFGGDEMLLECPKPKGFQNVSITVWDEESYLTPSDLDKLYKEKGLAPNPWHLIAFALTSPNFIDNRNIFTQWKNGEGKFRYAYFYRQNDKIRIKVLGCVKDWVAGWYRFSGTASNV